MNFDEKYPTVVAQYREHVKTFTPTPTTPEWQKAMEPEEGIVFTGMYYDCGVWTCRTVTGWRTTQNSFMTPCCSDECALTLRQQAAEEAAPLHPDEQAVMSGMRPIEFTQEWAMAAAEAEGDSDVTAGGPGFDPFQGPTEGT